MCLCSAHTVTQQVWQRIEEHRCCISDAAPSVTQPWKMLPSTSCIQQFWTGICCCSGYVSVLVCCCVFWISFSAFTDTLLNLPLCCLTTWQSVRNQARLNFTRMEKTYHCCPTDTHSTFTLNWDVTVLITWQRKANKCSQNNRTQNDVKLTPTKLDFWLRQKHRRAVRHNKKTPCVFLCQWDCGLRYIYRYKGIYVNLMVYYRPCWWVMQN